MADPWFTDADVLAGFACLIREGAGADAGIHGWRCSYPDRYGPCACVADTVREFLTSLAPRIAQIEANALREAADALAAATGGTGSRPAIIVTMHDVYELAMHDVYELAIAEAARALRARADEIEKKKK